MSRVQLAVDHLGVEVQSEVWVLDPDSAPWEVYTVLADDSAGASIAGDAGYCAAAGSGAEASTTPSPACC